MGLIFISHDLHLVKSFCDRVIVMYGGKAMETLPAGELDSIKAALKKRFGREVDVETAVDAGLIGGAVIAAGDTVIDGSLRGKLQRLQAALASQ